MRLQSLGKPLLLLAATAVFSGAANAQEHSYTPSDIEAGRGLYQANCLGCHGNTGSEVEGANLASGRFRRASSDEELIALVRTGIPGTLMIPRPQLSYGDLRSIVAFLRTMQTNGGVAGNDERDVAIGNPGRGEELFFGKAGCSSCHGVNGGGSRLYPDLANIGGQRSPVVLEDAMLEPQKDVRIGQRFYQVTDKGGKVTQGLLLNQDTHSVQLLNTEEKLQSFLKQDLSEFKFIPTPMPSVRDVLSASEVADLVAYMISLKGE